LARSSGVSNSVKEHSASNEATSVTICLRNCMKTVAGADSLKAVAT